MLVTGEPSTRIRPRPSITISIARWDGTIDDVTERSDTITAFRDRPEAEALLIVLDEGSAERIETLAKKGQFIAPRRDT